MDIKSGLYEVENMINLPDHPFLYKDNYYIKQYNNDVFSHLCENKVALSSKILIISGLLGTLLLGGGIFLGFIVVPYFVTEKIWEMKVLKEHTEQWDLFLKIPFPFTFKVHIFDVQNPDEVLQGETPVVKETGPYVYKVYKWNSDIEWNDTDTISYYTYMRFEFDKEASSPLSEEDTLTILNTPYNSMLLTVEATQPSALTMMDGVSPGVFGENDGLFIKVKVKDYLFDGLRMCVNMGKDGGFAAGMVCKQIVAQLEKTKNMRIVNNTILFANIHYKNNTHLGRFTIKSGINNRKETGNLILYNELPYTSTWLGENSLCNKIRGVTTIFPVSVEKNMVFEAFAEDVCR
ncbi:hypothetical protein NQ317_010222 [Molorchus minor]|uniref:Sensory neuron membrane protein 2 n=1 Tax=Molorchus minor TaxID=1323400 RepID=A0ABQ9J4F4_9CUCU|nr:hypothetical protein NQ317_010222 [Molorchus minor]